MTKTKKRILAVVCAILIFVLTVLGVLQLGCIYTEQSWEHWYPDYEKTDIKPLLDKPTRTDEDYQTIYAQTGLTRIAIDDMLARNMRDRILSIQDYYFAEHTVYSYHFAPFTYLEETYGNAPLAGLRDGDIIVSATTRVSWFRYGHAALVVDGEEEIIIEALEPGTISEKNDAQSFDYLANFMILRPNIDDGVRQEIVDNALNTLLGVPYELTTGVFSKKYTPELKGTQCAHLVWYAYKKYGIDLDSNGGAVVKPQDMALSKYMDVVQIFGFEPSKPWGKKI